MSFRCIKNLALIVYLSIPSISFSQIIADFTPDKTQGCIPLEIEFYNTCTENGKPIDKSKYIFSWDMSDLQTTDKLKDSLKAVYVKSGKKTVTLVIRDLFGTEIKRITKTDLVTVFENPSVEAVASKSKVCRLDPNNPYLGDSYVNFTPKITSSNNAPIVNYLWDFGDGSNFETSKNATHAYSQKASYYATVFVTDANGCSSTKTSSKSVKVEVNSDRPTADFTILNDKTCNSTLTSTFTNTSTPFPGTTIRGFQWIIDGVSDTVTVKPSKTFTRQSDADVRSAFLYVYGDNGCMAYPKGANIYLYKLNPSITINDSHKEITTSNQACAGAIQFSTTEQAGTQYQWDMDNDGYINSYNSTFATNSSSGQYQIKLIASNPACSDTIIKTFKVEPKITSSITPLGIFVCAKQSTKNLALLDLSVTAKNVDWYIDDATVPFQSGSGTSASYTFQEGKSYNIKVQVTSSNDCSDIITFQNVVKINFPKVDFTKDKYQGCVPLDVNFIDKTTYEVDKSQDFVSQITWDFGDGTVVTDFGPVNHKYTKDGDYLAKMTIKTDKGCEESFTRKVLVGAIPTIKINFLDTIVCAGKSISNQENRSGVSFIDKSYIINQNNTKSYDKVDSTYYEFTLWDTIKNAPNPKSFVSNTQIVTYSQLLHCNFNKSKELFPGLYFLKFSSFYNGCRADSNFIDVDSLYIHVKGPIVVHDQVLPNCIEHFKREIKADSIKDATTWNFNIYRMISQTKEVLIDRISNPTKDTIVDFTKYGYGTGDYTSVIHAYNQGNDCEDSSKAEFMITKPIAKISINDTTPCVGKNQVLTTNMPDVGYITNLFWYVKLPDGKIDSSTTEQNSTHKHHNPSILNGNLYHLDNNNATVYESLDIAKRGIHELHLEITDKNDCKDDTVFKFRAYQPLADFITAKVEDCLPIKVSFTDNTKEYFNPIKERRWYTNGDSVSFLTGNKTKVTDTYKKKQAYSIRLEVTDTMGCIDDTVKMNEVIPVIPPATIIPVGKVCLGTEAVFKADSLLGIPFTSKVDSMVWNFGDNSKPITTKYFTAKHLYANEITNPKVTLTAYVTAPTKNVCVNKDSSYTTDIKDAHANFSPITPDIQCKVAFLAVDINYVNRYKTVKWEETYKGTTNYKGDKDRDNISFQEPGDHFLTLTTTSDYLGCEASSATKTYNIPYYSYEIVADKYEVCDKEPIKFSLINTVNIENYPHTWNFGDGKDDKVNLDITHFYDRELSMDTSTSVSKQVAFVVDNGKKGCGDGQVITIKLRSVTAKFEIGKNDSPLAGCVPFAVNLTDKSIGAVSYSWNFGDGTTDNTKSPSHVYTLPGNTYNISLNIKGEKCEDTEQKTVKTLHNPEYKKNIEDSTICQDKSMIIKLTPVGGTTINSWVNDGSFTVSSDNLTATVNPAKTRYYFFTGEYKNPGDATCYANDSILVKVQERPTYLGVPKNPKKYLVYVDTTDNTFDTLITKSPSQIHEYVKYSLNNDSLSGISYKWEPSNGLSCSDCANPYIYIKENVTDMTYTITMTDTMGCFQQKETINLKIIQEANMGLPSAFTPNGDKHNDVVLPRGWGVKKFLSIEIYNRWGQLIYQTNDETKGWDGSFNGRPQDPDTYAWKIKYIDAKDKNQEKKGYITLLR